VPDVKSHALSQRPAHAARQAEASERAEGPAFASLLDDAAAAEPPAQPPKDDNGPRADRAEAAKPADQPEPDKPAADSDKTAADTDNAEDAQTVEASGVGTAPPDGSAVSDETAIFVPHPAGGGEAVAASDGKTPVTAPTPDPTATLAGTPVQVVASANVIAPAPEPTPQPAQTNAPAIVQAGTVAAAAAPAKPLAPAAAISGDEKPAEVKAPGADAPKTSAAVPAAAMTPDGKPLPAAAESAQGAQAPKVGETQPKPHGVPTPDAPPPTPSATPNVAAPAASADLVQPTPLTAPPHTAPATATAAAPPTAPAAPQSATIPLASVPFEIAGKALAGKNRFEIRLDPAELGRIDVRLDVDHDGNVTSRMVVDRPDTLDLLRRDAANLDRALQDAGLKTSGNGLQFSLRDQSANQQQGFDGSPRAHMVANDETTHVPEPIPADYRRPVTRSGGLDIRV
jgi:flagellar hook-length control protein FliK